MSHSDRYYSRSAPSRYVAEWNSVVRYTYEWDVAT